MPNPVNTGFQILLIISMAACSEDLPLEMVDCSMSDLSIKVTSVKRTDCGLPNGQVTVSATGGNGSYMFRLLNGATQTSSTFSELRADLYTIEVVDANNCIDSVKTLVTSKEGFSTRVSVTTSGCENNLGTVIVEPIDGVPPYKYQFGENSDYELINSWDNLASREYSVWVSDANDCFIGVYMFVPSGVSFTEKIAPLVTANCATSGCHDGSQDPDLKEYNDIKENSNKIKMLLQDATSSKSALLTAEEISLISCWIDDGAPAN